MPQQFANQNYLTYALVFTAVAVFAFLAIVTLFKRSQEKFEISGNAVRNAAIRKFIDPGSSSIRANCCGCVFPSRC